MGYVWLGENDWKAKANVDANQFCRGKTKIRFRTRVSGGLGLIHGLQAAKYEQQF